MYTIVYNTGHFHDDCDKWNDKERSYKTWENFQAQLQAAQCKYKRKQKVSTRSAEYHGANNPRETGEDTHNDLIKLATAAASDRYTMMTHSRTISDLTATISNLTKQLHQTAVRINTLKIPKEPETLTNRPSGYMGNTFMTPADTIGHMDTAWA